MTDSKIGKTENLKVFTESFLMALGDVSEWEHNGEVIDLGEPKGHCVCGHPIRYEFEIVNKNTKKVMYLGSECINNFQYYNKALYETLVASLEKWKAMRAEEKRRIKELEQTAEVMALTEKLGALLKVIPEIIENSKSYNGYIPRDIWYSVNYSDFIGRSRPRKAYKRLTSMIDWYTKAIKANEAFIEENKSRKSIYN